MQSDTEILSTIISRFPDQRNCINELFEDSESFRSLCRDYYDCRSVLDESTKNICKLINLQKEYQLMLSEIEDELLGRITI